MDASTPGSPRASSTRPAGGQSTAVEPGRTHGAATQNAAQSPPGVIDFDAPCRGCGYNVRGRLLNDTCPECAAPIRLALEPETLSYASPRWLTQLARGVRWTLVGMALFIPAVMITIVAAGLRASTVVGDVLLIAAAVTRCFGVWLLTSPDPCAPHGHAQARSSLVVRLAAPFSVAAVLAAVSPAAGAITVVGGVIQGLAVPAIIIEHLAMLAWIQRLGVRIPTNPLADLAGTMARRLVQVLLAVAGMSLLLVLVMTVLSPPATAGGVGVQVGLAAGLAAVLAALVLFVFGILYVLLLARLGQALADAARAARDNWAHAITPRPAAQMAEGARWT